MLFIKDLNYNYIISFEFVQNYMWAVATTEPWWKMAHQHNFHFNQYDKSLICQPMTHAWIPKLQHIPPLPPKCEEMLIFGEEIFLDHISKWLHSSIITMEDETSCLWSPVALGWLFLAKRLERWEFPRVQHPPLCKIKCNYLIVADSCIVKGINVQASIAESVRFCSLRSAL